MNNAYQPAPLTVYCAKIIANHLVDMTCKNRATFLLSLPVEIRDMIKCFPISQIDWWKKQLYLSMKPSMIKKFRKKPSDFDTSFQHNCNYGYPFYNIPWNKRTAVCNRQYCDNIITLDDKIYPYMAYHCRFFLSFVCKDCNKYFRLGDYLILRSELRKRIEKN